MEEAILDYQTEIAYFDEDAMTLSIKRHIAEEIADCLVMINQFVEYYEIEDKQIEEIMRFKIDRQLERINNKNNITQ